MADIIGTVAAGEITLSEAIELGKLIEFYVRTCEASDKAMQGELRAEREQEEWQAEQERRKRFPF
jgi:small ligand-binding sensory domain FIST